MQRVKKGLKNLIIFVSLGVIFLLSGIFFVGCGKNAASKITLTANYSDVSLYVDGESVDVTFTIGNYSNSVDPTLNYELVDSTSSPTESEHVRLEQISQNGNVSVVRLTGKSGGSTTLIAKTNEGGKKAIVNITVKEYASTFSFNDDQRLFVSDGSDFAPSDEMFIFPANVTEKKVTLHKADVADNANDINMFSKARLVTEQDEKRVEFLASDGSVLEDMTMQDVKDGDIVNIIAKYTNEQTGEVYADDSHLTIISGFQTENAIQVKNSSDEPIDEVTIIANEESLEKSEVKITVTVAYAGYLNVEQEVQDYIMFDAVAADRNLVFASIKEISKSLEDGQAKYEITLSSLSMTASDTSVVMDVYYKFDQDSFKSQTDKTVHQRLELPVHIKILPTNIVVNNRTEESVDNNYSFYNNYLGDYGWQSFKIDVYSQDSSFEYVDLQFPDDVDVKYKNRIYTFDNSKGQVQVDDISVPVYIRGASKPLSNIDAGNKTINFTVVSQYLPQTKQLSYKVKYSILTGAKTLELDDAIYTYIDEQTGVFVPSDGRDLVFAHLVSEGDFTFANVVPKESDQNVAIVRFLEKRMLGDGKYVACLVINPQNVGDAQFDIVLDNGVKLEMPLMIRVRDTFTDLDVNLDGTGNDGVLSATKEAPNPDVEFERDCESKINIVLQNQPLPTDDFKDNVQYGKRATIQLSSTKGNQIFSTVQPQIENIDGEKVVDVMQDLTSNGKFVISSVSYGVSNILFNASGPKIEEFKLANVQRSVCVHIESFVPVKEFTLYTTKDPTDPATSVDLYIGQTSDPSLQTVTFTSSILPSVAYGFYDPVESRMTTGEKTENEGGAFWSRYIYWTLPENGVYLYQQNGTLVERMAHGVDANSRIYRIGPTFSNYFGTFDITDGDNIVFTINRQYAGTDFSFTLYAAIRQYSSVIYFPVTIRGVAYNPVNNIYTNLTETKRIIFNPFNKLDVVSLGIYLNPVSATDTGIIARYISYNADAPLIRDMDIIKEERSPGVWLVQFVMNSQITDTSDALSGVLEIIPNAWFSDGQIISGFESSIIKFDVVYENGTEGNPFYVESAQDLINIGVDEASLSAHYILDTSIDLSTYKALLPIKGNFSGTLKGGANASIMGIVVQNGANNNFGLFENVSGRIENISFTGRFDVSESVTGTVNIGLVAGKLSGGTLTNIKVSILQSNININYANIGGVVGLMEGGSLTNINVLFDDYMLVTTAYDVPGSTTYVGGIVGDNQAGTIDGTGDRTEEDLYGYAAYSVYALIKVRTSKDFSNDLELNTLSGNAAAVAGKSTGGITNILAGGEIFAQNAAGISASFASKKLDNITTRVFVRGAKIGLVAIFSSTTTPDGNKAGSIRIQATDDGIRTGVWASMGVMLQSTSQNPLPEGDNNIKEFVAEGGSVCQMQEYTTFKTYIRRPNIINTNLLVTNTFDTDSYFGDYIVVDTLGQVVIKESIVNFEKDQTSFSVKVNDNFATMQRQDAEGDKELVIIMYYFEAAGYYQNGQFLTNDLQLAQDKLDEKLNRLAPSSPLYPVKIVGNDVSLVSQNDQMLEISSTGEMFVKQAGVAKVSLKSLLNENDEQTIYFNIINYFDIMAYKHSVQDGIFSIGNMIIQEGTNFPVYSSSSVSVGINPSYRMDESSNVHIDGVTISRDGLVIVDNNNIQLRKNVGTMEIQVLSDGGLQYGDCNISRDEVTFTKKRDAQKPDKIEDMKDTFSLQARLSCDIAVTKPGGITENQTYTFDVAKVDNITASYYEGATALASRNDNFVVYTSVPNENYFILESDDKSETLNLKVYDQLRDVTELFNITIDTKPEKPLQYKVTVGLNTQSELFKQRNESNIYKQYQLYVFCTSRTQEPIRVFTLDLVQEVVSDMRVTNYPSYTNYIDRGEGKTVIPGTNGLLSIVLSPYDADFEYITVSNSDINSLEGAGIASIELGMMKYDTDSEKIVFTSFNDVQTVFNGARISKDSITKQFPEFEGQLYARYLFSNRNINDGQSVGFDVSVKNRYISDLFTKQYEYTLFVNNDVYISIKDYPNKKFVARGLEYELDVRAIGYDNVVVEEDSRFASIENRDGKYYLVISNDIFPSDYTTGNEGIPFVLKLTGSREAEYGMEEKWVEKTMTILEYVINYDSDRNKDIVSGMSNGVISAPVGEKRDLNLTFGGDIEYNEQNPGIAMSIRTLLTQMQQKGTWNFVSDLNRNDMLGLPTSDPPETTSEFGKEGKDITTIYLKTMGYSFISLVNHNPANRHFYMTFNTSYIVSQGVYIVPEEPNDAAYQIDAVIDISSVSLGSLEHLNPVSSYEDFLNMSPNGYYIMTNDIEIKQEEFVPRAGNVAYFDGNGYSFYFNAAKNVDGGYNYSLGSDSSVGLFGTVDAGCVIKNVSVVVGGATAQTITFKSYASSSLAFGLVAGTNNGVITNAQVRTTNGAQIEVVFDAITPATTGYYFGGIAGSNVGDLTNSLSKIDATANFSMGGLVGSNSGHIASSVFREGTLSLKSAYNTIFGMGGLVASNSENGLIMTSYSSGYNTQNKPYAAYDAALSHLDSSVPVGGFVFENDGQIIDCYSNIPISTTSSSAGFSFTNRGTISRSFSTSVMQRSENQSNYYFAGPGTGTFSTCYYITGEVNSSLADYSFDGENPQPLKFDESKRENDFSFEKLDQYFSTFSVTQNPEASSAVWYYSTGSTMAYFRSSPRVTDVGLNFATGRIELVSANLLAYSRREQSGQVNSDGTYTFVPTKDSPADGSAINPYVIYSPETMEDYIGHNPSSNFRIVTNINYSGLSSDYSTLFNIDLKGVLEGNGMEISAVQLSSPKSLDRAGLFGGVVGSQASAGRNSYAATVMNLNLSPSLVLFTNATAVGALCGKAENANIYNVRLVGDVAEGEQDNQDSLITVTGRNIVGGLIGFTTGTINIKNVDVAISALASKVPEGLSLTGKDGETNIFDATDTTVQQSLSFAGGMIGYASGNLSSAQIADITYSAVDIQTVSGAKAGFVFGGTNANVKNIHLSVTSQLTLKPYQYGGFVTGEISSTGTLKNVYVQSDSSGLGRPISLLPYAAYAVGGIAGYMYGDQATIENAYISRSFTTQMLASQNSDEIMNVGGVVGRLSGTNHTISKIYSTASISTNRTLGGVVGTLEGSGHKLSEIAIKDGVELSLQGQNTGPMVGGFIGENKGYVSISDSYSRANIDISVYTYGVDTTVGFGGIIGNLESGSLTAENVYTTSLYNIVLQDIFSIDPLTPVQRCYTFDGVKQTFIDKYGYGDLPTEEQGSWDTPKMEIGYTNKVGSATNVYNSSILYYTKDNDDSKENFDPLLRGFTTIQARASGEEIFKIIQQEYGKTLLDINITADGPSESADLTKITPDQAFEKMWTVMKDKALWKSNEKDFATLTFEEAILGQI